MKDAAGALANMRENMKREHIPFIDRPAHQKEMIVVCGGPSLRSRLREVRARQKIGGVVVACNGALRFLLQNGIVPNIASFLDPSPVVAGFLDEDPPPIAYVIGSICHPSVLERLKGRLVVMWHPDCGYDEQKEILDEHPEVPSTLVGGGGTVGLRMLNLGYLTGYRRFHFYGLDGSYAEDGADHAYVKHDGTEPEEERSDAWFDGKQYLGSRWMLAQAGQFCDDFYPNFVALGCQIWVHGEGLIPDMCKALHEKERLAA